MDAMFQGIGEKFVTLKAGTLAATDVGKAVTITANGTAGLGAANNEFFGKVVRYDSDGYVAVQFEGFVEVPYLNDANAPVLGKKVVVDGLGNVRIAPEQAVNEGGTATYTIVEKGRGIVVSLDATNLKATVWLG